MATVANPVTIVAVHDAGTDFTNAHDTDPNEISATTVNDLALAARPVAGPVTVADGGSMAVTAADLKKGVIQATPSQARSIALPSATDLVSQMDLSANEMSFRFIVRNLQSSTHALTLTCTDGTIKTDSSSAATIAAAKTAEFIVIRTGATAVDIIRLFEA